MHERYADPEIEKIWSDENKLNLWQKVELAFILAKQRIGKIKFGIYDKIQAMLSSAPIDIAWWKKRDKEIHHDLNAFVGERQRHLGNDDIHFHAGNTSYDTEEPAFSLSLMKSARLVMDRIATLETTLKAMATEYRFTIMNGRTHGQEAELQSFGKRCLCWLADLRLDKSNLENASGNLQKSKFSGAIGNYGSVDPKEEKGTLELLGLEPYYGATQIMPREIYAPLAQALAQIVMTMDKIATTIRLGARSGRPIYQEPFGKKQTGSSVMPHKKNTILSERVEGFGRIAKGYLSMIMDNIKTWEERDIAQSSVERIAWPDLFHITIQSLDIMNKVLSGLAVYPDRMLQEIISSKACYAAGEAKEFLKRKFSQFPEMGVSAEEAYRMIQLAAFNIFEPSDDWKMARESIPKSLAEADEILIKSFGFEDPEEYNLYSILAKSELRISPQLSATQEEVAKWNVSLKTIFQKREILEEWQEIFRPSFLLRNEHVLYEQILGK